MLRGTRKLPLKGGGQSRHKEEELPNAAVRKITGNAELSRWSRDFSEAVDIRPLSSGHLSVTVGEAPWQGQTGVIFDDELSQPWVIKKAFGYRE